MNTWAYRLVAACVLTACCALAGRALNQMEKRRTQILDTLRAALPMLSIEMLQRLTPLQEALKRSGQPLLMHIAATMARGMGAREAWILERADLTARGAMLDSLLDEDLLRLEILFEHLGASGQSAQQLLLEEAERALVLLHEQAKKRAMERGKLYTNLGLLLGLAISVWLL